MTEPVDPAALRGQLRERMTSTKLADSYDLDRETHRAQVYEQMRELVDSGHPKLGFDRAYGGEDDTGTATCR